jgi:hypothetical protein
MHWNFGEILSYQVHQEIWTVYLLPTSSAMASDSANRRKNKTLASSEACPAFTLFNAWLRIEAARFVLLSLTYS